MSDLFTPLPGNTHRAALTYQFEHQVARTLHPLWAERLLPFEQDWWRSPAAEPRISAYLRTRLDLPAPFAESTEGLPLLPPQTLQQLIRLTGSVLLAPALRSIIDGTVLRQLSQAIGSGFMHLIRTLAPFLLREGSLGTFAQEDGETWLETIERVGTTTLAAATRNASEGALSRLKLKLDPVHADCFETKHEAPTRAAHLLMKKLLLREVDPQWAPLF